VKGGGARHAKYRYVNRAKRRETSGKSTPLTNQHVAAQTMARITELVLSGVKKFIAGLGMAVNTAPSTNVKAAIH
jgi:hypothetical protein